LGPKNFLALEDKHKNYAHPEESLSGKYLVSALLFTPKGGPDQLINKLFCLSNWLLYYF